MIRRKNKFVIAFLIYTSNFISIFQIFWFDWAATENGTSTHSFSCKFKMIQNRSDEDIGMEWIAFVGHDFAVSFAHHNF